MTSRLDNAVPVPTPPEKVVNPLASLVSAKCVLPALLTELPKLMAPLLEATVVSPSSVTALL